MGQYRKKPITINAVQLTELNIRQCYELVSGEAVELKTFQDEMMWEDFSENVARCGLDIPTLEDGADKRAKHVATIGDWIIQGVKGEFYPCKPDIFEETYEPAE